MGSGVAKGLPFTYRFEMLARRWGVPPYVLEASLGDPIVQEWVTRTLVFMTVEAVEVRHG